MYNVGTVANNLFKPPICRNRKDSLLSQSMTGSWAKSNTCWLKTWYPEGGLLYLSGRRKNGPRTGPGMHPWWSTCFVCVLFVFLIVENQKLWAKLDAFSFSSMQFSGNHPRLSWKVNLSTSCNWLTGIDKQWLYQWPGSIDSLGWSWLCLDSCVDPAYRRYKRFKKPDNTSEINQRQCVVRWRFHERSNGRSVVRKS